MPYFKTMGYTEHAGNFYLQPLNFKLRLESIIEAYYDTDDYKIIDYSSHMAKRVIEKTANKYTNRNQETSDFVSYSYKSINIINWLSNRFM